MKTASRELKKILDPKSSYNKVKEGDMSISVPFRKATHDIQKINIRTEQYTLRKYLCVFMREEGLETLIENVRLLESDKVLQSRILLELLKIAAPNPRNLDDENDTSDVHKRMVERFFNKSE